MNSTDAAKDCLRPTFDHWLLAQRHPIECDRFSAFLERFLVLRELGEQPQKCIVDHGDDHACCALEPWPITWDAALAHLLGDSPADAGDAPHQAAWLCPACRAKEGSQ